MCMYGVYKECVQNVSISTYSGYVYCSMWIFSLYILYITLYAVNAYMIYDTLYIIHTSNIYIHIQDKLTPDEKQKLVELVKQHSLSKGSTYTDKGS